MDAGVVLLHVLAALAALVWGWLLLFHGGVGSAFWRLGADPATSGRVPARWPGVVAVIPARNEAETVGDAVSSLLAQAYKGRLHVVVVDDHSEDLTRPVSEAAGRAYQSEDRLSVIAARDLPADWVGKVWAMAEGLREADRRMPDAGYVLFTDADIEHPQDGVARLVQRAESERLDLASLMVRLRCETLAERLTIPAFVFFFAMLYPFAWVARGDRATAAAAGGVMLVRREALERIGGLGSIRSALIDDCALAGTIKRAGGRLWLGLADDTASLRGYDGFAGVWRMIARSAYTQLRHSPWLLAGTILGMAVTYVAPPAVAVLADWARWPWAAGLGAGAWVAMMVAYLPVLRHFGQTLFWAPLLPLTALIYCAATLDSARRYHAGQGGEWKGRAQARRPQA